MKTRKQTFLQQLIKKKNDEASNEELNDDKKADTSSDFRWITVHACHDVHNCLTNCDDHTEELLSTVEQCTILWRVTDLDDLNSSQQLHNETRRDDGRDTEFHQCTTVRRENDTNPVEGISGVRGHDTEEWDLAAHQEDEEGDRSP